MDKLMGLFVEFMQTEFVCGCGRKPKHEDARIKFAPDEAVAVYICPSCHLASSIRIFLNGDVFVEPVETVDSTQKPWVGVNDLKQFEIYFKEVVTADDVLDIRNLVKSWTKNDIANLI